MEKLEKRQIPMPLRTILAVDVYLTDTLVRKIERFLPREQLVIYYQLLEISCHGVPWLIISLMSIWITNNRHLYQMQINFLMVLLLDIVLIGILKATARRRRPTDNYDQFSIGPDKYSFPSGHASRSAFIVYFFLNSWPISEVYIPFLFAWCFSVCMSRILMRRHYILDVVAGIVLGICEGLLISYIYLKQEICINLVSWITKIN